MDTADDSSALTARETGMLDEKEGVLSLGSRKICR